MKTRNKRKLATTRKKFISRLKKLYPHCEHDDLKHSKKYENHQVTYGEMEYNGMEELYNYVKKYLNINCFIDVGSGRGKLCMYMAAQPNIEHVLGVELTTERHDDAVVLKNKLQTEFSSKVELVNQNVLEMNLEKYKNFRTFIWFSNLCFDQSTTNDIFQKLKNDLSPGTIICCSKQPDIEIGEFLGTREIPMSWNKTSSVAIYRL
jgi:hypothetical protein